MAQFKQDQNMMGGIAIDYSACHFFQKYGPMVVHRNVWEGLRLSIASWSSWFPVPQPPHT